jgi:hypothetical protein
MGAGKVLCGCRRVSSKDMELGQRSDLITGTHTALSSLSYTQNSTSIQPIAAGQGDEEVGTARTMSQSVIL